MRQANTLFALQAIQYDLDLLFSSILFACRTADILDDLLAMTAKASGFLPHLHSMMVTMCQKSSLINLPKSVP